MISKRDRTLLIDKNFSDYLKFFTSLLILTHHYTQEMMGEYLACADRDFLWAIVYVIRLLGGFIGVAIFFFLSGYGLMESEQKRTLNFGQFIKKRLIKLYLPVLLVSLVWVFILVLLGELSISWSIVTKIFIGFEDNVLWFIKDLIALYLLFGGLKHIILTNKQIGWALFILGTVVISCASDYLFGAFSFQAIPLFFIGVLSSFYKYRVRLISGILFASMIISALCAFVIHENIALSGCIAVSYMLILLIILILSRFSVILNAPKFNLGISYDIYLVHNKILYISLCIGYSISYLLFLTITILTSFLFNKTMSILDK